MNSLEKKFRLAAIKEFLLPRSKSGDLLATSGSDLYNRGRQR